MNWDSIFNGIGTEIISSLISGIACGIVGYKVGMRKTIKQIQIAGNKSEQRQENHMINSDKKISDRRKVSKNTSLMQNQKAGDKSKQVQIGGLDDK